jgi:YbbR domain-containing protein
MSFREVKRRGEEARHVARGWLREFFLEDWTLKLLAMLITLGLWFGVTSERAPATVRLRGVPLEFFLPENVEISNEPVENVDVTLEGSQGKLAEINARNIVARADVTQLKTGDRVARLTQQNVVMDLPAGVRIVEVTPRSVTLRLEPVVVREVEVEARFEGSPPEGFARGAVQVNPGRVRVRGPESHVAAVERAHTETISLEGQRESLTLPQLAIDIPDRKVIPLDTNVWVRVEIGEEVTERRFEGVPVRSAAGGQAQPPTVTLTLRGPRSLVEHLRAEDVRVVAELREDGTTAPRLSLPPEAQVRVELVSTSPATINIVR